MTQDEIIRMFHEAGKSAGWKPGIGNELVINYLTHFADLVAEPWIETNKALSKEIIEMKKQAEQEPVAWVDEDGFPWKYNLDGKDWVPLYTSPVRTKDLTDDEIYEFVCTTDSYKEFARTVIAADREKNK